MPLFDSSNDWTLSLKHSCDEEAAITLQASILFGIKPYHLLLKK